MRTHLSFIAAAALAWTGSAWSQGTVLPSRAADADPPASTAAGALNRPGQPQAQAPRNIADLQRQGAQHLPLERTRSTVVLLPGTPADALGDGCWVRFYDGTGYTGANVTLVGPGELPRMAAVAPHWRAWDSAIVGPRARVTVFDEPEFRERTARLQPGAAVTDLRDERLEWFDEIRSARVAC